MTWDPFTSAHEAIFTAFQNHPPLAALVLPGNFVDTTDPYFQQFKPGTQAGDTPQVKILQDEFTLPPFGGNSTSVEFTQSYRVLLTTDVLCVVNLNQLKYLILQAMVKAGTTLGLSFVKSFELQSGKDDFKRPPDETQQSQRWVSVFTIRIQFYLSRQQLAAS